MPDRYDVERSMRKAAASAREVLLEMAAKELKTDRAGLYIENGEVKSRKKQQSISIGKLTRGKEIVKGINEQVSVTPPEKWKVNGTSVSKVNGESFLTCKHRFVSDIRLPGLLFGKILRPPSYGATLTSVDLSGAGNIPGVVVVHDGDFVGVAAPDRFTADEALKAIRAEWKTNPQVGRGEIFEHLVKKGESGGGRGADNVPDAAFFDVGPARAPRGRPGSRRPFPRARRGTPSAARARRR